MQDSKCYISTTLTSAVSAKNALQNVSGYSLYRLVIDFGMNVDLPLILTEKVPALESLCQIDLIQKKLAATQC